MSAQRVRCQFMVESGVGAEGCGILGPAAPCERFNPGQGRRVRREIARAVRGIMLMIVGAGEPAGDRKVFVCCPIRISCS